MNAPMQASTRTAALAALRGRFERAGIVTAASEAEAILLHGLGLSRAAFWCEPDAAVHPEEARALDALATRRERHVPLQHLIGEVDFHDVTLDVEPGVFVPRPETETLVEAALEAVAAAGIPETGRLLDLGTGTGAVAVAMLHGLPRWTGVALDRSAAAVTLATRNAARNGLAARLRVEAGDFAAPPAPAADGLAGRWADGPYHLVISNPPYVPTRDCDGLMPEVRDHDPRGALDGGLDGLDAYPAIFRLLPRLLAIGGVLALEIGEDQADAILALSGPGLESPRIVADLAGRPRVFVGIWRGGVE
ncbi:MAG TPA: peptide chain release factor N(5)-glutamine methyltransferase [Candidatus Eisenbacteria bacterium]|nr:peptide chain release factor N(5)-glutamine methyltransferase [Candidatus Eisenbacteria bacterium]